MMKSTLLAGLLLLATACDRTVENVDTLPVCLDQDAAPRLSVQVGCLSSSNGEVTLSCDAVVDGQTITISSLGTWERAGRSVTLDCRSFGETCTVDGTIADGTYTLVYGDETVTVDIPSDDEPCLGGEDPRPQDPD